MIKLITKTIIITILVSSCAIDSGDKNVELGSNYFLKGNYEKAENELKKAIDKKLFHYSIQEVYTILGNVYNELEMYDSSIFYHKKALQIDSNYFDALVNLGIVYRLTSEFELAEECYIKAKKINPEDPELYASLGALYIYKDEPELAIENLEKSIELDPQLVVAHSNYSLALAMIGEYDKAEKELKKAVAMGYKNGDIIKQRIEELKKLDD